MKKLLSLGVGSLIIGMITIPGLTLSGSQDRRVHETIRERFIGAWRLEWLEEEGADRKVHRADCTGLLVFTRDGHMSVQVMYRNPQGATQAGPVQYAQGGYEASFGTYEVDEHTHTFTYQVEGALVRSLLGKDLTRVYEFSGKQLILKSASLNEHWRVAWERVAATESRMNMVRTPSGFAKFFEESTEVMMDRPIPPSGALIQKIW
jgi:hypothetical protein